MYLSLDLETTGLDAENDAIIEIGAAIFDDNKIIKTFSKLINPLREVPEIITHITGITNEDTKGAPTIQEVQSELEQFMGDYPIVGHNINFDTSFLKAKGIKVENKEYDTHLLSVLLLPNQRSYSLETLTETLNITHTDKHRALDDALAAIELFKILMDKIDAMPSETLRKVNQYLKSSEHPLKEVFGKFKGSMQKVEKWNEENGEKEQMPISNEDILKIYDNKELLETIHTDYHRREGQIQMSEAILSAFEHKHHYIIEAGTGTGKTMAYLLPAIQKSLSENEKVVIATHTLTLQEQLIKVSIPNIKTIVEHLTDGARELKACTLKGRNNYLSGERFRIFTDRERLNEAEAVFACKIAIWLDQTHTGDKEELHLYGDEHLMFREVACEDGACQHDNNSFREACYLIKARKRAADCDIIIVNHSLLAQNLKTDGSLIAEHGYLIIDEAHHLEESFTKAYSKLFTLDRSLKIFEETSKTLAKSVRHLKASLFISESEINEMKEAIGELSDVQSKLEIIFGLAGMFINNIQREDPRTSQVILTQYTKDRPEWQKISTAAEALQEKIKAVLEIMAKLLVKDSSPEFSRKIFSTQKLITLLELSKEWYEGFKSIFLNPDEEKDITWIVQYSSGDILIRQAPLNIGLLLEDKLYTNKESIILTSATLSTNNNFDFIRRRLYLGEHFEELQIKSHFNYPDQVHIVVPEDIPAPNSPNYSEATCKTVASAMRKFDGRVLALFTSKRAIENTYMTLAPKLKKEGFEIYAQNFSGGKGKILEKFRQNPVKKAILGTNTFWEGIDIKGDDVKCVIIQKLPFDPPFDPIHSARSQSYMNGFAEYSLPRAIIRLKQGFGRLIRSESDTGTIIILDNRIYTKPYGRNFIESLPSGIRVEKSLL